MPRFAMLKRCAPVGGRHYLALRIIKQGYNAVVILELSRFHILDVAFQKYLCDVSGR
ncbi:hypothetical protein T4A_12101 [Trichinella pseudospiralis]|uniref:Uncharacterized protein n=1 Tax=Trichinella pseudospiralis TaxID=6337 RepID=A0A0V1DRX1_TRIPS|nr:hypothetical protein T4A_12101 [Trichinella pseudospiralis]